MQPKCDENVIAEAICTVARSQAAHFEHAPSGPLAEACRRAADLGFLSYVGNDVVKLTESGKLAALSKDPGGYVLSLIELRKSLKLPLDPRALLVVPVDDLPFPANNFLAAVRSKKAALEDVDDWVGHWHAGGGRGSLRQYLGMTEEQYEKWVNDPSVLASYVDAPVSGAKPSVTAQEILSAVSDDDLKEAAREALSWNKTGILQGEALRGIAARLFAEAGMSEDGLLRDTDTLVCREAARRFANL